MKNESTRERTWLETSFLLDFFSSKNAELDVLRKNGRYFEKEFVWGRTCEDLRFHKSSVYFVKAKIFSKQILNILRNLNVKSTHSTTCLEADFVTRLWGNIFYWKHFISETWINIFETSLYIVEHTMESFDLFGSTLWTPLMLTQLAHCAWHDKRFSTPTSSFLSNQLVWSSWFTWSDKPLSNSRYFSLLLIIQCLHKQNSLRLMQ